MESHRKDSTCLVCGRNISKEENDNYVGGRDCLWICQCCGQDNGETTIVCATCGALRDGIGDSVDKKDSENLLFEYP